jgi:adenylosuccinate synthase
LLLQTSHLSLSRARLGAGPCSLHRLCEFLTRRFADLINEDTLEEKIYELIKHQKLHYALAVVETDIDKEVQPEKQTPPPCPLA